jgi:hypothetical protein
MSSQNETHGDEDWKKPADETAVAECVTEIVEDANLLAEYIIPEHAFIAEDLADLMQAVNGACNGSTPHIAKLIRAASDLQKTLKREAQDYAQDLADERMEA